MLARAPRRFSPMQTPSQLTPSASNDASAAAAAAVAADAARGAAAAAAPAAAAHTCGRPPVSPFAQQADEAPPFAQQADEAPPGAGGAGDAEARCPPPRSAAGLRAPADRLASRAAELIALPLRCCQ